MPGDIYLGFFNAVILKGLPFCIFFSKLSVKCKTSKISPKCYVTRLLAKRFNKYVTKLCQWFYKLVSRVEPEQLVILDSTLTWTWLCVCISINLTTAIWKIPKYINTINTVCYLEMFNTLMIKWASFYYKQWRCFASCHWNSNFISIQSVKEWEQIWNNLRLAEVQ